MVRRATRYSSKSLVKLDNFSQTAWCRAKRCFYPPFQTKSPSFERFRGEAIGFRKRDSADIDSVCRGWFEIGYRRTDRVSVARENKLKKKKKELIRMEIRLARTKGHAAGFAKAREFSVIIGATRSNPREEKHFEIKLSFHFVLREIRDLLFYLPSRLIMPQSGLIN